MLNALYSRHIHYRRRFDMHSIKIFLLASSILLAAAVQAETKTIHGLGMSEKLIAGESLTRAIATSNAHVALAEQVTLSSFTYQKDIDSTRFKKITSAKISADPTPVQTYTLNNGTMGVIIKASTDFNPTFKDEICKHYSNDISSADQLSGSFTSLHSKLYKDAVKSAMHKHGISSIIVTGKIYTKNLKIKVNEKNIANITTTICVANIK